jgi:uncharacterized protein YjbI with pentapeptide repeats
LRVNRPRHFDQVLLQDIRHRCDDLTVRNMATLVVLILLTAGASACTTKVNVVAPTSGSTATTLASDCPTVGPGPGYKVTGWPTNTLSGSAHSAERCNLMNANLAGANLENAYFVGTDLSPANLTGADLRGAHLTDANLQNSNLTGADLTGADLADASLGAATLTNANLSGVKWSRTQCPDYSNSNADGGSCVGHEAVPVAPTG